MKKKILLEFDLGLSPKYKKWAKEAAVQFVELFPEFKDSLSIQISKNKSFYTKEEIEKIIEKSLNSNPNIDPQEIKKHFILQPDGTYLHDDSVHAHILKSIDANGLVDLRKWLNEKSHGNRVVEKREPIVISVTPRLTTMGYGISNVVGPCISAGACESLMRGSEDEEAYFKEIIIHELGHTFNATHLERDNILDDKTLGTHCADKDCLMYLHAYLTERFNARKAQRKKNPFCSDCMASMRDYMQNVFDLDRKNMQENQVLHVNQGNDKQNSDPVVDDPSFKKAWREIFQPSAEKQKAEYKEDIKAPEYRAEIKHTNGSVDKIVATGANNVSLSAKDKDGNAKMPNMQRFRDIVAYAQKQGSTIEFGDIKSADFKARLLLACMEAKPAMQMVGAPELNDAFIQSIQDEKIKGLLQIMKNKQQTQAPAPAPQPNSQPQQPAPQTEYENSREIRRRTLEAKEKSGKISKMEKAELDYIRAEILKQTEYEKAKAKYNSDDPRFEEHKQKSGLKIESFYHNSKTRKSETNWKLHLDVVPNRDHPITKAISEMLEKLDVSHKIAHGGDNGKGMTIYVGSYTDALRLSKEINARFGKDMESSPCYVDQKLQEHYFNPKVSGRFYMQAIFNTKYPRSSVAGICPTTGTKNNEMEHEEGEYQLFNLAQKNGIISAEDRFNDYSYNSRLFSQHGDFHKSYVFHNFEAYCSHKLYEKELGEYYCGKDVDKFEKDFFGDIIPEKGTAERANWDKAAQEYVSFIENTHPNIIQRMKQEAQKYHSVDFSKLPPMPQNTQVHGGGRSA